MDINWYGQACFKIKGKTATVIIDPFNPEIGLKFPKDMQADIVIKTHNHSDHNYLEGVGGDPVAISGPGEYEIKGVSVAGVGTYHDEQQGAQRGQNTIFNIYIDGLNIVHVGDLGHVLTQNQVEEIGQCNILMIPVGGVYTIDAKAAVEVVAQLEPRIILPMHYKIDGLKYDLAGVEDFLKGMGTETPQAQPKLSVTKDKLPEEPQVIVLQK